jgi:hypothetical protein
MTTNQQLRAALGVAKLAVADAVFLTCSLLTLRPGRSSWRQLVGLPVHLLPTANLHEVKRILKIEARG